MKKEPILLQLANDLHRFGWKWLVALVWPVYWTQDCCFQNGGWDIITFENSSGSYFFGTAKQVQAIWNGKG